MKIGERFLLVRQLCLSFFERIPYFFICFFFFAQSFSLHRLLHGVYTLPLARHNVRSLKKVISVHTLERLLMLWLLVITFDTLLIKLMQTAQLTFNGRTVTEFFAVLFLFRGIPMSWKGPRSAELSAIRTLLGSFSILFGGTLMLQMGDTVYRAKIYRDQLFVWNLFFINNGWHRTTALYRFPRSIGPRYKGAAVYYRLNSEIEYADIRSRIKTLIHN